MGLTVSHKAAQKLVVRNKKKFWRKQWNDINRQP